MRKPDVQPFNEDMGHRSGSLTDQPATQPAPLPGPILLYDGVCAFCNRTVKFVLERDKNGAMMFAPLQGVTAQAVLERHPEVRSVDSIIMVTAPGTASESVRIRTAALFDIARYLGGIWHVLLLGRLVPRPLRDLGYALFARYRYGVFGRYETCPLPSPEDRARFLP